MSKFDAIVRWFNWHWPAFAVAALVALFAASLLGELRDTKRQKMDRLEQFKASSAEDIAWVSACVQHGTGDLDGCILRLNSLKFNGVTK